MLKTKNTKMAFAFAAFVFVVGASFFIPIYGEICSKNEYTGAKECATDHVTLVFFWQIVKAANDFGAAITALATVAVASFTFVLWKATEKLWKSGESQHSITNRAFVFNDLLEWHFANNSLVFLIKWRNSGNTPTRYMRNWTNWKSFIGEPPDSYDFPDLDELANELPRGHGKSTRVFIGPNAYVFGTSHAFSRQQFEDLIAQKIRIYVWGWTTYEDVFGASHVTKFCNELKVSILGVQNDGVSLNLGVSFPVFKRHNCTDEECAQ